MPLDGNAEGGLLGELFAPDVTAAEITCGGCGAVAAFGAVRVYGARHGRGLPLRALRHGVLRLTHTPAGLYLDMRGARRLFVAAAST